MTDKMREALERLTDKLEAQISGGLCYFTLEAKHAQLRDAQATVKALRAALAQHEQRGEVRENAEPPYWFAAAGRLALDLQCLLLDIKDMPTVTRWWDSAHEALEHWHEVVREIEQADEAAEQPAKGEAVTPADVQRVIDRLMASDPNFDDCEEAADMLRRFAAASPAPSVPEGWRDAFISVCGAWDGCDRFVSANFARLGDAVVEYPVLQGTSNQLAVRRVGRLAYDGKRAAAALRQIADMLAAAPEVKP